MKRILAIALALCLLCSVTAFASEAPAPTKAEYTAPADMTVASIAYGWVTTDAVKNEDNTVTVGIIPAGGAEEVTYTTAVSYGITNAMTQSSQADAIASRLTAGVFAEIVCNAAGEVIDMRQVEKASLNFDTAKYGGDLTAIGSTVELRGAQYTDNQNNNATGDTGWLTGLSGQMVAYGWLLEKNLDARTIVVGDGNRVMKNFDETYAVADDVKVYTVDNSTGSGKTLVPASFVSTESSFEALKASELVNGNIYNTPSSGRYQVLVIFDKDYTQLDSAKVVEIYEYANHETVDSFVGKIPQSVRVGCDLSEATQGNPSPNGAPYLVAANPTTVVDGKMWTIGDIEVNCPIFKGGSDASMGKAGDGNWLVQFDTGWPKTGYQYMVNIEKVGQNVRDLDMILVPHGHGDHYGSLVEEWETIVRSGAEGPIVYESYEDTIGFDKYGFPEIGYILTDPAVRTIITDWYPNDQWVSLGDGLDMIVTLTPGHSQGCGSAVFQVTVGESGMKNAKFNYEQDENGEWVATYGDYNEGDELFFCYMGGYGINGLSNLNAGFRRTNFVSSLRYIESVLTTMPTTTGKVAAGVYNLAQHTNQFPYTETAYAMNLYNEMYGTDYPFLHFMREGKEEVINFCEKRASAILYSDYTKEYMVAYEGTDAQWSKDGASEKKENSSPFYEYDGIRIKTDITSPTIKDSTLEDLGPYKHVGGEVTITLVDNVDVTVMHGYDVFLNKGVVPAEANIYTNDLATGLADQNWNLVKGFAFAKDGFVEDPDVWYVQVCARVNDEYDGNVYSNKGANEGAEFISGPVDAVRGANFFEVMRTGGMTRAEAEQIAASLEKGASYKVNILKTGDIVNAENVLDTFVKVD